MITSGMAQRPWFAALDAATGEVIAQCKPRHRHQEFLAFLKHIEKAVPADLDVHLIVDNYATHKHPKVKAWLVKHPRYHVHFTPTYTSWLNQVERWFGLITQQAIRRGLCSSVRQLIGGKASIAELAPVAEQNKPRKVRAPDEISLPNICTLSFTQENGLQPVHGM